MPSRIPYHRSVNMTNDSEAYSRSEKRQEMQRFYHSPRWRRLRAAFLAENPLCLECAQAGRVEAAVDVHHIKERADYPDLAFEWSNLEPICKRCHNAKRREE